jgi:hypothetical protein
MYSHDLILSSSNIKSGAHSPVGSAVQTFLPYPDFAASARALDDRRLGKQRSEALTILRVLAGKVKGWRHHPAVLMWKGFERPLKLYMNAVINEWERRGFQNGMPLASVKGRVKYPPWLGDERFHACHRSNLLRKDPAFYGRYGWKEPADLPYQWPVRSCAPVDEKKTMKVRR